MIADGRHLVTRSTVRTDDHVPRRSPPVQ